jgi:hypothetical protein
LPNKVECTYKMSRILIDSEILPFDIENIQEIIILTDKGEYHKVSSSQFILEKEVVEVDLCRLGISTFDKFLELFKEYEKAIEFSKKLELDISCNYLGSDEFIKILEYLEKKKYYLKLTHFQVNHNRVEKEGMNALLNFFFNCPWIEEINCAINYVSDTVFREMIYDFSEEERKKIHFSSY